MKNILKFNVVLFVAFLGVLGMKGQTYIADNTSQAQMLIEQETNLNIENSSAVNTQNGVLLGNNSNAVFLTQIGDNNQVNSVLQGADTNNINTAFVQVGDDNQIDLSLRGETFDLLVLQSGNDLRIQGSNALNLSENVKTQINQQGNDQSLIIEGQNSISNSMKINMSGQGQEVIVRSFN